MSHSAPSHPARVVIKIGGAMLHSADRFVDAVQSVADTLKGFEIYWIVGGGGMIDAMRELHAKYPGLSHARMHWRCIRMLDATWEIACELLPLVHPLRSADEIEAIYHPTRSSVEGHPPQAYAVRVEAFYSEATCEELPELWRPSIGWETTTDALAWLLAKQIGAQRLVLLKRVSCVANLSLEDAALQDIVDPEIVRLHKLDPSPNSLAIELRSVL